MVPAAASFSAADLETRKLHDRFSCLCGVGGSPLRGRCRGLRQMQHPQKSHNRGISFLIPHASRRAGLEREGAKWKAQLLRRLCIREARFSRAPFVLHLHLSWLVGWNWLIGASPLLPFFSLVGWFNGYLARRPRGMVPRVSRSLWLGFGSSPRSRDPRPPSTLSPSSLTRGVSGQIFVAH